jgi:hypothetical protein
MNGYGDVDIQVEVFWMSPPVMWRLDTNVSEDCAASIFKVQPEILVSNQNTTWLIYSEDHEVYFHRRKTSNLSSE